MKIEMMVSLVLAVPVVLCAQRANEFFVAPDGCDTTHDGLGRVTAFATVQRGVDALEPGDTLTILPGEYREAVSRTGLGGEDAETVIRAAIPGTVLLRGDEPAPTFEQIDGYRFVYGAPFPLEPQAVNEIDTLTRLTPALAIADLEFEPGRFYYDPLQKMLYVSTSDLQPPDRHVYSVSTVAGRAGIFLREARRVTIDGLSATGFSARRELPQLPSGNSLLDRRAWGFYLSHCRETVIRNCTVFMNQAGIGSHTGWTDAHGRANRIENGVGVHNSLHVFNPTGDEVRGARVWGVSDMAITTHGRGVDTSARFDGNFAWSWYAGRVAQQMKSPGDQRFAYRCIAPDKMIQVAEVTYSLMASPVGDPDPSNIYTALEADLDMDAEFADPERHDYRLQATSRFRGAGPDGTDRGPFPYEANVFFLAVDGDDAADGLSVAAAWRTLDHARGALRPGDTLYLLDGTYRMAGEWTVPDGDDAITLRGRGRTLPVVDGAMSLSGQGSVMFERLHLAGPVTLSGNVATHFDNCRFSAPDVALSVIGEAGVRVTHGVFEEFSEAAVRLDADADVGQLLLQGNVFDNRQAPAILSPRAEAVAYSDHNGYARAESAWRIGATDWALDALPGGHEQYAHVVTPPEASRRRDAPVLRTLAMRGPSGQAPGNWRMDDLREHPLRVEGPFLHSASANSANLEWWASEPASFEVRWGTTPEAKQHKALSPIFPYHPHGSHVDRFNTFSLIDLKPDTKYYVQLLHDGEIFGRLSFTTPSADPAPRTLHVAPDGDDDADGLSRETAWRTLAHAADRVRPGDTVRVGGGVYHASVRMRVTGTPEAPIVFRAAPGEQVFLDGHDHMLNTAFNVFNKHHLSFDGFYLRNYRRIWTRGLFNIVRGGDITVSRCFADGRLAGGGSTPELVTGGGTDGLTVRNCVQAGGWGFVAYGAPRRMRLEHNVVLRVSINPIGLGGAIDAITVRNNIITDNLPGKRSVSLAPSGHYDAAPVELADNAFFLRWPESERSVLGEGGGTLADFEAASDGRVAGNLATDPRFAGVPRIPADADIRPPSAIDRLLNPELPLDFDFLFARHPDIKARGIGLQPKAFADFHFNRDAAVDRPLPAEVALVMASHRNDLQRLRNLADGNPETRWDSGEHQETGMWLELYFAQPRETLNLTLNWGGNHPDAYAIHVLHDGDADFAGTPVLTLAGEPGKTTVAIPVDQPVAGMRIVIAEPNAAQWWAIHELTIDGRSPVLF